MSTDAEVLNMFDLYVGRPSIEMYVVNPQYEEGAGDNDPSVVENDG